MPIFANNFIAKEGVFVPPPVEEKKVVISSERKSISFKDLHKKLQEETKPKREPKVRVENPIEPVEDKPKYHEVHDGDLHKMINTKSSYLTDMINLEK